MGDFDRGTEIVVMVSSGLLFLLIGGFAAIARADELGTAVDTNKYYFKTVITGCNERCVCYYLLSRIDYKNNVRIAVPVHIAHCKVQDKCLCFRVQKKYLPCEIKVSKCELSDPTTHKDDCSKTGCICQYRIKAALWIFDKAKKQKVEKVVIQKEIFNAPYDLGCRNSAYEWCKCEPFFDKKFDRPQCELSIFACESLLH